MRDRTDLQTQVSACQIKRGLPQKKKKIRTMHETDPNKVSKLVMDERKTERVCAADRRAAHRARLEVISRL